MLQIYEALVRNNISAYSLWQEFSV